MIYYQGKSEEYLDGRINSLRRLVAGNYIGSLNIELSSACNLRCTFCPSHDKHNSGKSRKGKGLMGAKLFSGIIADSSVCFPIKSLILHKGGESLLNKNIEAFITLAKSRRFAETITLTTNGLLLTPEKLKQLQASGLDSVCISIDAAYRLKAGRERHVLERNIRGILSGDWKLSSINMQLINFPGKNNNESKSFLDKYASFAAGSKKIHINFSDFHNWGGWGRRLKRYTDLPCDYPWYGMAVNYDGTVSVCCMDWNSDLLIGDLRRQTLSDIWNGEAMRKIRRIHLSGDLKPLPVCRKCTYKPHAYRIRVGRWIAENLKEKQCPKLS